MTRKVRIIYLVVFLILLEIANVIVTGSWHLPSGNPGLWFQAGLLMVIIGSLFLEHFFTTPADAAVNSLALFVIISVLEKARFTLYWEILRWYCVIVFICAISSLWLSNVHKAPELRSQRLAKTLKEISTFAGGSRVIFSAAFVLAVLAYVPKRGDIVILFSLLGAVLSAPRLQEIFLAILPSAWKVSPEQALGYVVAFEVPSLLLVEAISASNLSSGDLVSVKKRHDIGDKCIGIVLDLVGTPMGHQARILLLNHSQFSVGEISFDSTNWIYSINENNVADEIRDLDIYEHRTDIVGLVSEGSDIERIKIAMLNQKELEEGQLVGVLSGNEKVLYQITNAVTGSENLGKGNLLSFPTVIAHQLGRWNEESLCFSQYGWVPELNAPVFVENGEEAEKIEVNKKEVHCVGFTPRSNYPICVNVNHLVNYHASILGVTGRGKTFLVFDLVEKIAEAGMKVLCLDPTGDYKSLLPGVLLKGIEQIEDFLNCSGKMIGILELPSSDGANEISEAYEASRAAFSWAKSTRTSEAIIEPSPRVCIVMEEAHCFAPETFMINQNWEGKDTVQRTARLVMQGRKYGIGFIVVSQRTACVTKSVLTQCNTLFAFQAFDETSFDFLRGYMGAEYVNAVPELSQREAIVVGRAVLSNRPVIVKLQEQRREIIKPDQIIKFEDLQEEEHVAASSQAAASNEDDIPF